MVVQGKYQWDLSTGKYVARYRPYYNEWVRLLQLVTDKIYVAHYPVKINRIVAQYELKNLYRPKSFTSYFRKVLSSNI